MFGEPMSKVGRQPIEIGKNITVSVENGKVQVKGPGGVLIQDVRPEVKVAVKEGKVLVSRTSEGKLAKSLHGLTRTLIANMVKGVSQGWEKRLEMHGTGYRARFEKDTLVLTVGFSHPVEIKPVEGITFKVEGNDKIIVSGIDKAQVGQVAAQIRSVRPPEPYKGKGIRYEGEKVRRKPGKAGKVGVGIPGAPGES